MDPQKLQKLYDLIHRSEPGQGESVRLWVVDDEDTVWHTPDAEDYADCQSPVVVKAKRYLSRADVVRALLKIASAIDAPARDTPAPNDLPEGTER